MSIPVLKAGRPFFNMPLPEMGRRGEFSWSRSNGGPFRLSGYLRSSEITWIDRLFITSSSSSRYNATYTDNWSLI